MKVKRNSINFREKHWSDADKVFILQGPEKKWRQEIATGSMRACRVYSEMDGVTRGREYFNLLTPLA